MHFRTPDFYSNKYVATQMLEGASFIWQLYDSEPYFISFAKKRV